MDQKPQRPAPPVNSAMWIWTMGLFVAGLATVITLSIGGGSEEAFVDDTTTSTDAPTTTADAPPTDEFASISFEVDPPGPDGEAVEGCALLAETSQQLSRGMMHRDDFSGYDAMVFRFEEEVSSSFFMQNVRIPLSIAWFDRDGEFVSSADMEPCPPGTEDCPLYSASAPYTLAVEVPQGRLPELGIAEGSSIQLGEACTPA